MDLQLMKELYEETDASCRYQRVAAALEAGISRGLLKSGDALPTQRALAAELHLTVGTVTHGYAEAARRGLITGVTGRGTFVTSPGSDVDILPPPAPLPPSTQWPDASPSLSPCANEPHGTEHKNLGFIAPFEHLNPSLHAALERMIQGMDARAMAELQSYHRPAGMERHRECGAAWAGRYGVPVSGKDVLICAGSQHALVTILTTLCTAGERIAVETLSYPLLRHLSWRLRLPLAPIRTDACGMLPDALENACRSGGIGGRMLDAMLARCGKRACLEAELPETELAARRIGFYERHGFTVNADYSYFQPALAPGGSPIPLYLLTTGGARTVSELRAMETLVHTRVYGQTSAAAGK